MMPSDSILQGAVEATREAWQAPHREAMACRDLERVVDAGVTLFRLIRSADQDWTAGVEDGRIAFDGDTVRLFTEAYAAWLTPYDKVIAAVKRYEDAGHEVAGCHELRRAATKARQLVKIDSDRIVRLVNEAADASECRCLDEVLNGSVV